MYLTDETMDEYGAEIAQYAAIDGRDAIERYVSDRDYDMSDCVHVDATIHNYSDKAGIYFRVWECGDCGRIGEVGKEF